MESDLKRRILFVDDENRVLGGLRRMLGDMRREWDLTFVDSGEKALAAMLELQFDVVVSDMRMPKMNGAALLKEFRRRSPRTARIILSGFSDEEAVLQTVGPAHQYLAKPCDTSVLIYTIKRILALRRFLNNDDLVGLVSGLEHLPSPPEAFARLLRQLESPKVSMSDIADNIGEDLAMTVQTLKLTNSAYFALHEQVDDLHHAVKLLGVDTLKRLFLVAGFYQPVTDNPRIADQIETLSKHSLCIGAVARAIAAAEGLTADQLTQAASAGMLCHIGTLALMANWPERFSQALGLVENEGLDIVDAERRIFGAAHPEIGAYILGLWGFADPVIEAVACHHSPWLSPSRETSLVSVYAAQHLFATIAVRGAGDAGALAGTGLDMDYLREAGLHGRVPHWIKIVKELKMKPEVGKGARP